MIITQSNRIFLRTFHSEDLAPMAILFSDPEVMKFGSGPQDQEWVKKWLRGCLEDYYVKWGFGLWAVIDKNDKKVMGFCGLTKFNDVAGRPEIEVGYRLQKENWGKGYATEAAQITQDFAFDVLGIQRLISIIDPRNVASVRVAEKCGLTYEKTTVVRGPEVDIYAIMRASG
jgi:RimJ/RimL family protein N-acetyltransferase